MSVRTASSTSWATWSGGIPPLTRSWMRPRISAAPSTSRSGAHDGRLRNRFPRCGSARSRGEGPRTPMQQMSTASRSLYSVSEIATTACFVTVVRAEERCGGEAHDRRRVHDVALALLDEQRHEGGDAVHDAPEIDLEDPAPVLLGNLPDRTARADASVVVHEVYRVELSQRPVPQLAVDATSDTSVTAAMTSAPEAASCPQPP